MDKSVGRKRLSHWLLRVYLASAAVAAVLACAGGPRPPFWLELALLAPLFPAVLLAFDVCAFRFAHSALGPYRRSPLPRGGPVLTRWLRAGRIGLLHLPASFHVFTEGIGFSSLVIGSGFVPRERIRSVLIDGKRGRIGHDSKEVREPLYVPADVAEALRSVLAGPAEAQRAGGSWSAPEPARWELAPLAGILALLLIPVWGFVAWIGLECAAARREIAEFIREGGPRVEVLIDGKPLPSGADLLPLLADMETGLSSNRMTERRFPAELRTGPRSITFVMARKRGDPTRYAVYRPARAGTRMNPIGHVRTHLLDAVPSGPK